MSTPTIAAADFAPGDYVLASKYTDGDPQDPWAVGFYKESYERHGLVRHIVVDEHGQNIGLANGYRRAKRISQERGAWLLAHAKEIEQSGLSVWHFARCSMGDS